MIRRVLLSVVDVVGFTAWVLFARALTAVSDVAARLGWLECEPYPVRADAPPLTPRARPYSVRQSDR